MGALTVSRLGDKSTSGGTLVASSLNVFVEKIPVSRLGDAYVTPKGPATAAMGSTNVFVNSIPVHRMSDKVSDGSSNVATTATVFSG